MTSYIYLIGLLAYGCVWGIVFLRRPDLRRPMMVMGGLVGVLSFVSTWLWWSVDWWHIQNMTGTRVGVEDFILGFITGGVATVLYEAVFRRRLVRRDGRRHTRSFIMLWTICLTAIAASFWGLRLSSFYSFLVAAAIVAADLMVLRRDLFQQAVVNGLLMTVAVLPLYYTMLWLQPDWVQSTYFLNHLSRVLIGGIPLEEFVFFFLMGFTLAPGYEYWQNERLEKMRE